MIFEQPNNFIPNKYVLRNMDEKYTTTGSIFCTIDLIMIMKTVNDQTY